MLPVTPADEDDASAEADSRPVLDAMYRALIHSGVSADDALSAVAAEHRKMRAEWRAAKEADGCSQE